MERLGSTALQMFSWCEVLIGLSLLPAVVVGSDQDHCLVPAPSDEDTNPCPPWFVPQQIVGDNSTVACFCGPTTPGITCDPQTCNTSLSIDHCLTYDPVTKTQVGGTCQFQSSPDLKTCLPVHISELNDFMCGKFNREGQLCGKCKKGFGPAILTLSPKCANCTAENYGWAIYVVLEFLPITVFYLFIVIFQVSGTAGPLNAFIFSAQIIVTTINVNNSELHAYSSQLWSQYILQLLIFSYDFWNLDFFRSKIPLFCVSDKLTDLHVQAMGYLPAIYPLLLIVITYILIEMHDRNVRVIVWLWKPVNKCLAPLRGRWDPKASIISTFATFLTLAYSKLIIVSDGLLNPSTIIDIRGNSSQYLLLAPTVPYFGDKHLPFAILSITVLLIFIALPLLILLLYPTTPFHKVLGYIKVRWHALHTFADVFQGCYKNRTDGTCDYRYFSAFYFILRVVIFLVRNLKTPGLSWTISAVCFAIGSLLFALLRPYKKNWLNVLDCLALALLALIQMWILYSLEVQAKWFQSAGFLTAVPLLYLVIYATYKLLSFLRVLQKCQQLSRYLQQSLQQRWQRCKCRQQEHCDEEQLPDRMVNPNEYDPLLHNRRDVDDRDNSMTENPLIFPVGAYTNDYGTMN